MTNDEILKYKEDMKLVLNTFYERDLRTDIKIVVPEFGGAVISIEHNSSFITEFDQLLEVAEAQGLTEIVGPGAMFPTTVARNVFEKVEVINFQLIQALFTAQNAVDAINREDYQSDEVFMAAVDAVEYDFDIHQIFDFSV
jgi:hypothetical protein